MVGLKAAAGAIPPAYASGASPFDASPGLERRRWGRPHSAAMTSGQLRLCPR